MLMEEKVSELYFNLKVISKKVGLSADTILECLEEGLISPCKEEKELLFDQQTVKRLIKIKHLKEDLGVNLAGIDIILRLCERIEELNKRINALQKALGKEDKNEDIEKTFGPKRQRTTLNFSKPIEFIKVIEVIEDD